MEYYEVLKNLRVDRDLTQADIASVLGVAQRTYADYESGNIRVTVETMISLAKFYNVDMNYICGVSSNVSPFPNK